VSAIPKPHLAAAADALPEPTKETFMTAAQEWFLEGKEEGRIEGKEEGLEAGERRALASTLTRQVRLRFRDIPPEAIARIEAATKPELERWLERILTAETLDDLFA
jgi:predicted transposase YdaD